MHESETIEFKKSLAELSDGLNSVASILKDFIINAFCHRDYRDPDEVRIAVFKDRIEVRNPGTLMEGVSLKTLKTAKVSRRRNPIIADLLRHIQFIEAWGRGIPLIVEKAPNVRFTQVAGNFITEFPRLVITKDTEEEPASRPESRPESNVAVMIIESLAKAPLGKIEIARAIGHQTVSGELKKQILWLLQHDLIERTLPDRPNGRQKEKRAEYGKAIVSAVGRQLTAT